MSPSAAVPRAGRLLAIALLAALATAGCAGKSSRRGARVPILVAHAEQRSIPYEIEATGTVEPIRSAAVTAQVGGLVTRMALREGDEVRTGQVLMQIDRRSFTTAVDRTAAELARDRAQAEAARLDLRRAETLAEGQLIATSELEQKRAAAEALA